MSRRNIIILAAIVIVIGLIITRPWTYLINVTVDEEFPFEFMTEEQQASFDDMPEDVKTTFTEMASDEDMPAEMVQDTLLAQLEPGTEAEEEMPESHDEPTQVAQGSFVTIDPVHGAEGTATIFTLMDGNQIVRFEDFSSTNGPELHVYLTEGTDANIFASLGDNALDLGLLKGNMGNQNYFIPEGTDVSAFTTVVIYCQPFGVVFSVADLTPS